MKPMLPHSLPPAWLMPLVAVCLALSSCARVAEPEPLPERPPQSSQASPFTERKISDLSVRFVGAVTVDEGRLRNLTLLKNGGIYTTRKREDSIKALYESGMVDDVWFAEAADGDQVRVTMVVQTRPGLGPILHLIGNSIFSDQKLLNRSVRCCPEGEWMSKACLEQACRRIEAFYRRQGYPATRVEIPKDHPWIRTDPDDPAAYESCIIRIEEGPWTMTGQRFSAISARRGR